MVAEDAAELLVRGVTGAFALDGHDDCFAWVVLEEGEDFFDEIAEVFGSG